jgi:UDP-2,3-diacylglucosamine pyrophosphatase LpxH
MKTYLASDFHNGLPESRSQDILNFLDIVQDRADELILLGDIYETWANSWENIVTQEPYKTVHEKIIETSRIVPVSITAGNHDYDLKMHIKNPNIVINDGFTRDNIRYEHGWKLDVVQMAAYPYYGWILNYFPYIYQRYFYHPKKLMYSQNDLINDVARGYAKKNGYKMICYGHTHYPNVSDDKLLVNCGDMVKDATYVVLNDGKPELKFI